MNREDEIQELCKQVLNMEAELDNSDYENYICPLCDGYISYEKVMLNPMDEIKHTSNCAYLIAKDLSTNKRNNNE